MKNFKNFTDYTLKNPLALSLGMFDGVHIGHQYIIEQLKNISKERQLDTALITFWPHPRFVFNPNEDLQLLTTLDEKKHLIEQYGIQYLFVQEFDEAFRNLSGEEFVREILLKELNVKYLIIGYNHSFGKDKSGNFQLLKRLSGELGFEVEKIEAINIHENNISSTKIRNALLQGNILDANEMLGYHYPLTGKVIHGKKLGRTIGYPTANIDVPVNKLLPKSGAYIVEVWIENTFYKGMLSIGTNPTVDNENNTLHTEVYILDFDQDIYGKEITVKFRDYLHDEIRFEGLEKLIEKLDLDKRLTEEFQF